MKSFACSVGLIVIGVVPVAADNTAPRSLHMRANRSAGSAWSPMRRAKRIAQVAPAGGQPAPAIYNGPALDTDEPAHVFLDRQFYVRLSQRF